MANNSKIEWTQITWNFITGCTKVSDGCVNCYIERTPPFRMAGRKFDKPGIGGATGVKLHSDRLHWPITKWRKPSLIFVNSLADLFHEDVPDEFIAKAFAVMRSAPQHTFQVLTKRHARMRSLLRTLRFEGMVVEAALGLGMPYATEPWPLPNVWVGVSVENQQWADIRIPALLETPAAVRWLSCEPLLGPLEISRWLGDQHGCAALPGDRGIPGSHGGRVGDRPPGSGVEGCRASRESVDWHDESGSVLASSGGTSGAQLLSGPGNVRSVPVQRHGPPIGVAELSRSDPRGSDRESQERHLDGQPSGQSGIGDELRAGCACAEDPAAGADQSVRGAQRDGEADLGSSGGDSSTPSGWGTTGVDSGGLPSAHAASLTDCSRRPSILWVVCGGESGPGARPMDLAWVESLVDQCRGAGVSAFVKQLGSRFGKQHHDIDAFPEALRVREYPQAVSA